MANISLIYKGLENFEPKIFYLGSNVQEGIVYTTIGQEIFPADGLLKIQLVPCNNHSSIIMEAITSYGPIIEDIQEGAMRYILKDHNIDSIPEIQAIYYFEDGRILYSNCLNLKEAMVGGGGSNSSEISLEPDVSEPGSIPEPSADFPSDYYDDERYNDYDPYD